MRRYSRSVGNPPHTPPQEGVAERMELGVPDWNTRMEHYRARSGPHRHRPFRRPPIPHRMPSEVFCGKKRATITQKQHPSAAPGPFSQTGFPRLCSLYVVICLFFSIQNRPKTRKSPRIASTDGGSLVAKKGLKLQRGAVFECVLLAF